MDYANQTQLSIYDIGRINFQVKKILLGGNILSSILSGNMVKDGRITSNSSLLINTETATDIQTMRFMVTSILLSTITSMQPQIMDAINSLGYTNPNTFYTAVVNRINMLYTVLQISENEFSIILV